MPNLTLGEAVASWIRAALGDRWFHVSTTAPCGIVAASAGLGRPMIIRIACLILIATCAFVLGYFRSYRKAKEVTGRSLVITSACAITMATALALSFLAADDLGGLHRRSAQSVVASTMSLSVVFAPIAAVCALGIASVGKGAGQRAAKRAP